MVQPDLNDTAIERIRGMVELRDCVHQLIDLQMDEFTPDAAIREKQVELNRLYDAFTAKYDRISNRGNKLAFSDDSSYYLLCSLEVLDDDGNFERKADMFTKHAPSGSSAASPPWTLPSKRWPCPSGSAPRWICPSWRSSPACVKMRSLQTSPA